MTDARRSAAALTGLVFGLVASMTYLLERLYERARTAQASDPRSIIYEVHANFYWRAFLAAWWGVVCAWLAWSWLSRQPANPTTSRRWVRAMLALLPIALLWTLSLP